MFYKYFLTKKDGLILKLKNDNTLKSTEEYIKDFYSNMYYDLKAETKSQQEIKALRAIINTMNMANLCINSIDSAKFLYEDTTNKKHKHRETALASLSVLLYIAIVILLFLFTNNSLSIIITILLVLIILFQNITKIKENKEYQTITLCNSHKLINGLSELMVNADAEYNALIITDDKFNDSLHWNMEELLVLQILLEAKEQEDGEYCLKALPRLVDSLKQQGFNLGCFNADTEKDFDILPGTEDGYTIRPAIYINNKLVLKGQATRRKQ